jgi:hypothetical protein
VGRVGHRHRDAQRDGDVVHPAGHVAGLDDQQRGSRAGGIGGIDGIVGIVGIVALMRDQQVVDALRRGLDGDKAVVVRGRVVDAQHAVELAQVQREDAREGGRMRSEVQGPMHGGCSFRAANGV